MNIAGIRSNRGDIYQTMIAFDWALTILSDPEFQWLEVDSTAFLVDDVVVGKSDGTLICCQCKKNQADFRAWSITDLADELHKASLALTKNHQAQVRFYSRSEFGALAKLREYRITYSNKADYHTNMTGEHEKTDRELAAHLANLSSCISTYDFLYRTSFEITPDFGRMETLLHERLRQMASNSKAAFYALWMRLDKLGGRVEDNKLSASAQHRLTKDDLKGILHQAGALLAPEMSLAQVRMSIASTSAIGRSWHRDIAGHQIPSPVVNELLAAIDSKKRSILLTGLPGSGKTCVMLRLQEALERRAQTRSDLLPLFIQSREFADLVTARERQAQGLPEQWVEQTARLAEDVRVVVVIDSLDVLSIAREHDVLTYFLAQIDRLLLVPNVTVITACRDFDRKYDRRIAVRQWDCEVQCSPLDWDSEIAPLLNKLEIDSTTIDAVTRDLIQNPRELSLFVELAQREGSFNVVTSQALAQRYLDTIVQADPLLGDAAMQAIESIAYSMLKSRCQSIPHQRFRASQDIARRLQSLNVLRDTHDGQLMFGHQTLLDVLVISGAVRKGISLNDFVEGLQPVPFVRPSIRSFVAQLATGERREFRKQLRAVMTGNAAFHIRRLIAELFAQQLPREEDWPLIRDLRDNHREVFQVVYTQASAVEWHHFWLSHLVPELKEKHDADGLTAHIHRVAQWGAEDAAGVVAFWMETLSLVFVDGNRIAEQLVFALSSSKIGNLTLVAPLVERLLRMPRPEHSLLGHIVARCVSAGAVDDGCLWRYIADDVNEDAVREYHFGNNLHCKTYEFGIKNDNFLANRMLQSSALLDLALSAIEQWSRIRIAHYGAPVNGYCHGFLDNTSYIDVHSQTDYRHLDGGRILFDAIEAAIQDHAQKHSDWWQQNRERLYNNNEGALCYFAVKAFTKYPQRNIDLIGCMLCDRKLLQFELSYELGELIKNAFIYVSNHVQDAVMVTLQAIWNERESVDEPRFWEVSRRAEYISAIPCHLRSMDAQALLDDYEAKYGTMIRKPFIGNRSGTVAAPFSFEVFLNLSDVAIVRLLAHYSGYVRNFDDFLVGGESEVGWQLQEASSRQPSRFLRLLVAYWADISASFRDNTMAGVANYLAYRFGNLRANDKWVQVEKPDPPTLANQILDELERHSTHWHLNRTAAEALKACAHVIQDTQDATRLVFLAIGFTKLREESTTDRDSVDLLTTGINMMGGVIAQALMVLANHLYERDIAVPELLPPTLRRYANSEHPAIRALILEHLSFLQSKNPELGWELFHFAMQDDEGLWHSAERCLYYAYHDHFEIVAPLLERIHRKCSPKDMETWGRISALSALSGHIDLAKLLGELKTLNICEAWKGAASVWTHTGNIKQQSTQCFAGIEAGLRAGNPHAPAVSQLMEDVFRENTQPISVPPDLILLCFNVFESAGDDKHHHFFGFDEWLNATSQRSPEIALATTEIYLAYIRRAKPYIYDHENRLVQLVTRLFAEAEEREESDRGAMLRRVVAVQDMLLSLGLNSINDWLLAAERQ